MSYINPEILNLYSIKNSTEFLWFKFANYSYNTIEPTIRYLYESKYQFSQNEMLIILSFMILVYSLLVHIYYECLYRKYINLLLEYKFTIRRLRNRKTEIEKLKKAIKIRDDDLYTNDTELEIANNKIYELEKNINKNNFHMTLRKKRKIYYS